MPEPSGLPGDWIHLKVIKDPRVLRAAWAGADAEGRWMLAQRLAELEPEAAMRLLIREDSVGSVANYGRTEVIFDRWLKKSPAEALRFLGELKGQDAGCIPFLSRNHVLRETVESRMREAPREMLRLLQNGGPEFRSEVEGSVYSWLIQEDPSAALDELESLPVDEKGWIWQRAGEVRDPATFLQLLEGRKNVFCPDWAYARVFESWAKVDLPAACSAAEAMPPGPRRESVCRTLVEQMVSTDPEAALAWVEANAPSRENRGAAFGTIAEKNPERALELCGQERIRFPVQLHFHLRARAEKDWDAVWRMAEQARNRFARNGILSAMGDSLSFGRENPLPEHLGKLEQLLAGQEWPPGKDFMRQRWELGVSAFLKVPDDQLPLVADWVKAQPERIQGEVLGAMRERMLEEGFPAASAWLAELPHSVARTKAMARTASEWADRDPRAAADFSLQLPEGAGRDYAVLNTALAWQKNDPEAARQWVEALPESAIRTRALADMRRAAGF